MLQIQPDKEDIMIVPEVKVAAAEHEDWERVPGHPQFHHVPTTPSPLPQRPQPQRSVQQLQRPQPRRRTRPRQSRRGPRVSIRKTGVVMPSG